MPPILIYSFAFLLCSMGVAMLALAWRAFTDSF